MIAGRHRSGEGTPAARAVATTILLRALLVAVLIGVLVLAVLGWEWGRTRGRPVEHTVVVSVDPTHGQQRCGRHLYRDKKSVTRRSTDAPSDLPSTFTTDVACDVPSVGDRETVVRVPRGDQDPKVYVDPPRSLAAVAGLGALGSCLTFLAAAILFGIGELWFWWRRLAER